MANFLDLLKLYFVTWNVATTYPEQNLHQLLGLSNSSKSNEKPDIYIVGLQEVKSQPQNIVLNMFFEDPWTKAFREILKEFDYVKIVTNRMQGLVISLFCLKKHIIHLRLIETQYTKTGFGGLWGNKGAVSIRFDLYGINICLVNAHLSPHDHLFNNRIIEFDTIMREHFYTIPTKSIMLHNYVFWFGDLNFRLGDGLNAGEINNLIKENHLAELLSQDQLKIAMKNYNMFSELSEGPVNFPPTYKFEFGSQDFDLKRRPSWTDRILFKNNLNQNDETKIISKQLNYQSHQSYVQSDHKPVSSEFEIVVKSKTLESGVEFHPINVWYIDEESSVNFQYINDEIPHTGDWIGLYHADFSGLDEYLVYEYISCDKSIGEETPSSVIKHMSFSDNAVRLPGLYRLVYVTQRNESKGVLGMSSIFTVKQRDSQ
ncbi:inositol polyphosphate 5-phosphatase K-like isoform X1 [Trichogramma pretiosum]|uniref:inositol polyphosphate 5-phosphatase K-like isoform X1 n=2 Tax=Trichogramma pretiosum TaxID=7493 RepID=UPI0006C93EC1|nr:inositol polyphosphate 5-phosphatase K-like isoform X1 [Trichogramma pretiosum]